MAQVSEQSNQTQTDSKADPDRDKLDQLFEDRQKAKKTTETAVEAQTAEKAQSKGVFEKIFDPIRKLWEKKNPAAGGTEAAEEGTGVVTTETETASNVNEKSGKAASTDKATDKVAEKTAAAKTAPPKKKGLDFLKIVKKPQIDHSKDKLSSEERQKLVDAEKVFQGGLASIRDLIAPSSMDVEYDHLRLEGMYAMSFYVYAYPRYIDANWLSPVVNFDVTMDMSQYIYPISSERIMKILLQIMKTVKRQYCQLFIVQHLDFLLLPGLFIILILLH